MVQTAAATELERLTSSAVALRRHVAELLRDGMTLMTTSLSSTILQAVKEVAAGGRVKLQAIVCEARPLFEGVQTAEAWADAGIDVTLITDAQAGLFVGQADLVLVGAACVIISPTVRGSMQWSGRCSQGSFRTCPKFAGQCRRRTSYSSELARRQGTRSSVW